VNLLSEHLLITHRPYRASDFCGAGEAGETYYQAGAVVLWSAPHAVRQVRNGRRKPADAMTGALAETLAGRGGGCLALRGSHGDANFDAAHPFKNRLAEVAGDYRAVVDLHGMTDAHAADLWIGLGPSACSRTREQAERLGADATDAQLVVGWGPPFCASRPETITGFLQARGVCVMQLEIARRLRDPQRDPDACEALISLLAVWAKSL
jgi:hypothetical protein